MPSRPGGAVTQAPQPEPGHAGEDGDRFNRLLEHMPIALWQVDARKSGEALAALRASGVSDAAAYLADHPQLVDFACDAVQVTAVNRAAVQLLGGASQAELVKPVRYLFEATPDAAVRVMTAHFNGARNHSEELKINRFDGRTIDVLFLVTYPQPPEDQATTFISMIDITGRLAAEAELRRLQADFAHAARLSTLGELVTSIAHEVKQPLAAIVANGAAGLRWLSQDGALDRVETRLERVIECAEKANEIIVRIQHMAAKRAPMWTDLDMHEVVDEALQFVRFDGLARQIRVVTELDPDLPRVRGDRVQLQQVLVNLFVNAFQAMDGHGARDRVVRVRGAEAEDGVEFSISDSGPGIAPENLDRIFTGFFTTKESGMGIGLTICQSIIAGHGGEIDAVNLDEGGAMMRFRLPASGAGLPAPDPGLETCPTSTCA